MRRRSSSRDLSVIDGIYTDAHGIETWDEIFETGPAGDPALARNHRAN